MSARLLLFLTLLLLAFGFAPAPLPRARRAEPKDDLGRMQGTWVAVRYEFDGRDHVADFAEEIRFTFDGTRMITWLGDEVQTRWRFELSPASVPRAITRTSDDKKMVASGIYRLEGDRLIICEGQNERRPSAFGSEGRYLLFELKRR